MGARRPRDPVRDAGDHRQGAVQASTFDTGDAEVIGEIIPDQLEAAALTDQPSAINGDAHAAALASD
jgi:hypothetical protein